MMHRALLIWIGSLTICAQTPPPPQVEATAPAPKFDVVSVKECKDGDTAPPSNSSPGRLSLGCWNLKLLVQYALDIFASGKPDPFAPMVPTLPIEGLPVWANSARYTIDAATEHPQIAAMMMGPMLQELLETRFHLKAHRETREGPVYLMTVAKGGLKLRPTQDGSCVPFDLSKALNGKAGDPVYCGWQKIVRTGSVTVVDIRGIRLSAFARLLHPDGMPVIDQTETQTAGPFDIHLEWGQDQPDSTAGAASDPSPHTSAIVATREQLGLDLHPAKGKREVLVIDRLERPTGN